MATKQTTNRHARKARTRKASHAAQAQTPSPAPTVLPHRAAAQGRAPGLTDGPTALDAAGTPVAEADVAQPRQAEGLPTTPTDLLRPSAAPGSTEVEVGTAGATEVPPPAEAEAPTDVTPTAAKATRRSRPPKANREPQVKKPTALDAAARILAETAQPMSCPELIATMAEKGYWASPKGQTPQATLYAALLREINAKGTNARFQKAERGKFTLRGQA